MTLAQVPETAPAVEPISLAEAKLHLRIDSTDEDPEINAMIVAAREQCEFISGRQFINATWKEYFDAFPAGELRLARPPLSSVTSIQYVDTAGNTQTWSSSEYQVDTISEPARVKPAFGESWPSTRDDYNAVTVTFIAGYGSAASDVPAIYKRAIRFLVGHWFENREAWLTRVSTNEVRDALHALLSVNRVMTF